MHKKLIICIFSTKFVASFAIKIFDDNGKLTKDLAMRRKYTVGVTEREFNVRE